MPAVWSQYPHQKTKYFQLGPSLLLPSQASRGLCVAGHLITHWKLLARSQEVALRRHVCTTCENSDLRHVEKGVFQNTKAKPGRRGPREAF